ncbi:unnamed protein product [Arctia plantaginis]|uniref:Uncharacterized protein n=1 Tax=Arctia plantaginis TaxID=874455 RepID=A0A8S0ZG12_ARCPL|nr:unnamed protein product [Arctia plantaginis]
MNKKNRYELHINKLKEVNGIKAHNVLVTRTSETDESLIYINNPVECSIPNTFLTQEQFKTHLINNIKKQQIEFEQQKLKKHLNMFKFKPKKKENKKPFVWSLLKIPTTRNKHQKANLIHASTQNVADEDKEDLSSTTVLRKETTDRSRDLFIAMLNGETLATVKSSTNLTETTLRSISEDPITDIPESFRSILENYLNHTDSQISGESFTSEQQEVLNATIGDITTPTTEYDNTSTDNNSLPNTIIVTDTIVAELSKLTTTGTTKSTRTTRGRPFVFMN